MTVIVYRDGVLAADRMSSTANLSEAVSTKIHMVVHQGETPWAVALCGTTKGSKAILKHLELYGVNCGRMDKEDLPGYEPDHTYGFAINAYGTVYQVYGDGTWLHVEDPQDYYVDGAGYQFAMGACAAGAGAVLAVLLTGAQHQHCGYGATSVNVKDYLHGAHQTAHSQESLDDDRQMLR